MWIKMLVAMRIIDYCQCAPGMNVCMVADSEAHFPSDFRV